MKKLGLIGGTSWHSTIEYYKGINAGVSREIGSDSNPVLILYSINIQLMRSGNVDEINSNYLAIAKKLQTLGAEGIIICANTPHLTYDYVQPKIDIPILHIADSIGKYAQNQAIHTLGLLGTTPTAQGSFITTYLENNYNIPVILPTDKRQSEIHDFISNELTQGQFTSNAKSFFIEEMNNLKSEGAKGIILGCTELPILLEQSDFDLPLINTTQLHIQDAVRFILD